MDCQGFHIWLESQYSFPAKSARKKHAWCWLLKAAGERTKPPTPSTRPTPSPPSPSLLPDNTPPADQNKEFPDISTAIPGEDPGERHPSAPPNTSLEGTQQYKHTQNESMVSPEKRKPNVCPKEDEAMTIPGLSETALLSRFGADVDENQRLRFTRAQAFLEAEVARCR